MECLVDITELWEEEKYHRVFSSEMEKGCRAGGRVYGVPLKEYSFAVWYLKDAFRERGLRPPKTWDGFLNLCEALKESGIHPIISSRWGTTLWLEHLLLGLGGPEFYRGLMEGTESWTDPVVVAAYQLLKELINNYFYPNPYAYNFPEAWMKLNRGEAAMQLQGDWVDGMWQQAYGYSPEKDYDCFFLPPINPKVKRGAIVGGNAWIAFKRTPEVMEFLRYSGSREAQELLAAEGMGILSRKDISPRVYSPVLRKLRNHVIRSRKLYEFGVFLPQEFIDFEGLRRLQIFLNPTITEQKIKELLKEMDYLMRLKSIKTLLNP